jgi:hypothetical protein
MALLEQKLARVDLNLLISLSVLLKEKNVAEPLSGFIYHNQP